MRKSKFIVVAISCLFLFLIACAKSTAPKCDDEKVKESVIQIVRKAIIDEETKKYDERINRLKSITSPSSDQGVNLIKYCDDTDTDKEHYAEYKQAEEESKKARMSGGEALFKSAKNEFELNTNINVKNLALCIKTEEYRKSKVLAFWNEQKMGLTDIRTTSVDDKTGKRVCECNFMTDNDKAGKPFPMTYTSELSDGGKNFYVAVTSGL